MSKSLNALVFLDIKHVHKVKIVIVSTNIRLMLCAVETLLNNAHVYLISAILIII